MPSKMYVIKISSSNLGQAIDGLRCRAESYRNTEQYYVKGHADGVIEEVCDEVEACDIAETYEGIIEDLENQIKRQDFMDKEINQHLANTGGK